MGVGRLNVGLGKLIIGVGKSTIGLGKSPIGVGKSVGKCGFLGKGGVGKSIRAEKSIRAGS